MIITFPFQNIIDVHKTQNRKEVGSLIIDCDEISISFKILNLKWDYQLETEGVLLL